MRVLRKILQGLVILALLYGTILIFEFMTTQELTRASSATQETVCLIWKPRVLRGDGVCYVNLLNPQGKVVDTTQLGLPKTGFDALQQYGQLEFQGTDATVRNRQTSELVRHFVVRDGHFYPAE